MYWLRLYELFELEFGHEVTKIYIETGQTIGPGFLNAVNNYYGYRVWR